MKGKDNFPSSQCPGLPARLLSSDVWSKQPLKNIPWTSFESRDLSMEIPSNISGFSGIPVLYNSSTTHYLYARPHASSKSDSRKVPPEGRTLSLVNLLPDTTGSHTHIHFLFFPFIHSFLLFISPFETIRLTLVPSNSAFICQILSVHPCPLFAVLASRAFLLSSSLITQPLSNFFFPSLFLFPFPIAQSILLHFLFC